MTCAPFEHRTHGADSAIDDEWPFYVDPAPARPDPAAATNVAACDRLTWEHRRLAERCHRTAVIADLLGLGAIILLAGAWAVTKAWIALA